MSFFTQINPLNDEVINFTGKIIMFGGEVNSGNVMFLFELNIWLVAILQFFVISLFIGLLNIKSRQGMLLNCVLPLVGGIAFLFILPIVELSIPSFLISGATIGIGVIYMFIMGLFSSVSYVFVTIYIKKAKNL